LGPVKWRRSAVGEARQQGRLDSYRRWRRRNSAANFFKALESDPERPRLRSRISVRYFESSAPSGVRPANTNSGYLATRSCPSCRTSWPACTLQAECTLVEQLARLNERVGELLAVAQRKQRKARAPVAASPPAPSAATKLQAHFLGMRAGRVSMSIPSSERQHLSAASAERGDFGLFPHAAGDACATSARSAIGHADERAC